MRFIVSSSTLLKQLQSINGVLVSNATLPILDNILFSIEGKVLTLSASDLDTTMSIGMEVESKEDGSVAIPAKLLLDTLKTFPEQPLTFSVDATTFGVEISSDFGKYKLSGYNGDEFPKTPEVESPATVSIAAEVLSEAINKTIFATGNDELRPVMTGVFFQLDTDSITFVATDAHKLVRYKSLEAKTGKASAFIAPKKPLNLLKNLLSSTNAEVDIQYNESNANFTFDNISLTCRLIDGKYPNYEAVIPKANPNKLTVDRQSFLNSIKGVSIFANKTTNQVRFKISGSELTISAEDIDFSNEANERLTCSYEGDDMEIGFNSKFVLEMLANVSSENIIIELSDPNRAGIILPGEMDKSKVDMLMLVMPVMLNN